MTVASHKKTCFVYWDPHPAHRAWAESVRAQSYSFVPRNSLFLKSHGLLLHLFAFLKALVFLPRADVYLLESPMMITAVLSRVLFFPQRKVLAINSDPFLWVLPRYSWPVRAAFSLLIKRINGYLSTSAMMDSFADTTGKPHTIVALPLNPSYLNVQADMNSINGCFIGPHLNTKKGVDILIDVFSALPHQEQRKLFLIGNVHEPVVQKKLNGKPNIIVTGRVPRPEDYLKQCGLYLNLARFEPAGINILEAMAAGIPPIVSRMCGFASLVEKVSPKLVVPLNKERIVKTILWLERSGKKSRLGQRAKRLVRPFTPQHSVRDFQKKFAQLLLT